MKNGGGHMTKRHLRNAIPTALIGMALLAFAPGPAGANDPEGRWKIDGSRCYFDGDDEGPDQCRPSRVPQPGRWKVDGAGGCYFDSTDDGPNQCTPAELAR
jgi:hypothetical protein